MTGLTFVESDGSGVAHYVAHLPTGGRVIAAPRGLTRWEATYVGPGAKQFRTIAHNADSAEDAEIAARDWWQARRNTDMEKTRERIRLNLIDDNPWQPRVAIDPELVEDMANSIAEMGLLSPPLARRSEGGRVQLAFGHQRVAGCRRLAERKGEDATFDDWEIELDIADISDDRMAVIALAENVTRKQLTAIETVRAYRRAIDETGLTIQALADQLGMRRDVLTNQLRVLHLPDFVLEHVESGALGLSVAREFLVLRNGDHAHTDDMSAVVEQIVNELNYDGVQRPPNWTRVNVRRLIGNRIAQNEKDWRPLGDSEGHTWAGASRSPNFDADEFAAAHPLELHTVPHPSGSYGQASGGSRLWTCSVRDWTRAQTAATREANKQAEAKGVSRDTRGAKPPNRDQQFEQALAKDPVWRNIKARRETVKGKKGPDTPVSVKEKAALGTRAELQSLSLYGGAFCKLLENGDPDDFRQWEDMDRLTPVAPYFNLSECQRCISGAAYGKVDGYHYNTGLDRIRLVCTNRRCYERKLSVDTSTHLERVQGDLARMNLRDGDEVRRLKGRLAVLSLKDLRTVAATLLAAQPVLELHHGLGVPHKKWSHETEALRFVTGMMAHQPATFEYYQSTNNGKVTLEPHSLDQVSNTDLLELTASLMVHHLRQAGKLDDAGEKPDPPPDALAVREMLTGEPADAEVPHA